MRLQEVLQRGACQNGHQRWELELPVVMDPRDPNLQWGAVEFHGARDGQGAVLWTSRSFNGDARISMSGLSHQRARDLRTVEARRCRAAARDEVDREHGESEEAESAGQALHR